MKNEPILSRALVAGVIAAAVGLLKSFGVEVSAETSAAIVEFVLNVAPLVAIAWSAWSARKRVTPVTRPKADDGSPLVPEGSVVDGRHRSELP